MLNVLFLLAAGALAALAQDPDRVTVPLTDPSKPAMVSVSLLHGSITVTAHQGRDVIVEAKVKGERPRRRGRSEEGARTQGLRRLDNTATSLSIEEQDNQVKIGAGARSAELLVQVPVQTSLKLRTVNDGDIVVEGVSGEIDVNNMNGKVIMRNISGVVLAHALNGDVTVTMDRVTADKAMSFSSLNGDIDVTLPPDTKANLKMKTENGDIFTDFEITMVPSSTVRSTQGRDSRGRFKLQFDKAMVGAINGGGPEIQLTTLNGRLLIRKKK